MDKHTYSENRFGAGNCFPGMKEARGATADHSGTTELARILKDAAKADGNVIYPLLARLLVAHMYAQAEETTSSSIQDTLDELQLVVALEVHRAGIGPPGQLRSAA